MKDCVIYSRVSTKGQDFESQTEDLIKYAKYIGYSVARVFGEVASGFNQDVERVEYEKMKEYVISNGIKQILIWELSRLSRNTASTLNEIKSFSENGINVYFKKENLNTLSDTATDKMILTLLSSVAELERDTILQKMGRGRMSSVLKGKRTGYCFLPYGFSADEHGYLIIHETEAKIVKEIFDMYASGVPMRSIAINLNSRNIPTRHTSLGKVRTLRTGATYKIVWRNNSIITILKNRLYIGERIYKNEVIKVPQIISLEVYDKVQEIISGNVGYRARTKYEYLFKTKLFCGHCGYMMGTRTETRYKHMPSVYYCNGRYDITFKCKAGQFDSKVFDEYIYNQLFKNIFFHISMYEENIKVFNFEEKQNQIEFFKSEILKQEAKKKRINNMYKDGHILDPEFKQEHAGIRNTIVDLTNNINKIEKEIENFQDKDFDLKTILASLTNETNFNIKYDFIQKYADKILVYKVNDSDIDFSKLIYTDYWKAGERQLKKPSGRNKLIYIEIFAFGNPDPVKVALSNVTKICYTSKDLRYNKVTNYLTIV